MESAAEHNRSAMERFGFGRLFWLTHEAVVGADIETERILLWNPSAERIFGYTQDEAIGMPLDALVPPSMLEAHHDGIRRFRRMEPARIVGGPPVEVPAVRKDGEPLTVSLTLTAVDEPDQRQHVIAVIRDVTAQRAAEDDRRQLFESMQSFLATASHDLRTPLTAIIGIADALVEHAAVDSEELTELMQVVLRSGLQATRLVDDMHTLSTIQAGALDVRPGRVRAATAVAQAIATLDRAVEVVGSEDTIWVDGSHLQRILANLLENAYKYGRPPVRISIAPVGAGVEVRVSDAGDGVPDAFTSSLFEPFTRADEARAKPGTGLGLSIVKGLTEANGGTVRYEPNPSGGSCFVLTFPSTPVD